ncbi:unnamed protein product, partial [Rangifer tarandus platyrhynchus]
IPSGVSKILYNDSTVATGISSPQITALTRMVLQEVKAYRPRISKMTSWRKGLIHGRKVHCKQQMFHDFQYLHESFKTFNNYDFIACQVELLPKAEGILKMYFPFHFYILKYMHISVKKKKEVINRTLKSVSRTEDILCKICRAGSFLGAGGDLSHACFDRLDLGKEWAITHGNNLQDKRDSVPQLFLKTMGWMLIIYKQMTHKPKSFFFCINKSQVAYCRFTISQPRMEKGLSLNAIWNMKECSLTSYLQCRNCINQSLFPCLLIGVEISDPRNLAESR